MAKLGTSSFTGGKLNLKGDKRKKKSRKKSSKSKHSLGDDLSHTKNPSHDRDQEHPNSDSEEELTTAEKRLKSFKQKSERKEMEKIVKMSHRERVEDFNTKLGELTELNDIPRVSAAGNG